MKTNSPGVNRRDILRGCLTQSLLLGISSPKQIVGILGGTLGDIWDFVPEGMKNYFINTAREFLQFDNYQIARINEINTLNQGSDFPCLEEWSEEGLAIWLKKIIQFYSTKQQKDILQLQDVVQNQGGKITSTPDFLGWEELIQPSIGDPLYSIYNMIIDFPNGLRFSRSSMGYSSKFNILLNGKIIHSDKSIKQLCELLDTYDIEQIRKMGNSKLLKLRKLKNSTFLTPQKSFSEQYHNDVGRILKSIQGKISLKIKLPS